MISSWEQQAQSRRRGCTGNYVTGVTEWNAERALMQAEHLEHEGKSGLSRQASCAVGCQEMRELAHAGSHCSLARCVAARATQMLSTSGSMGKELRNRRHFWMTEKWLEKKRAHGSMASFHSASMFLSRQSVTSLNCGRVCVGRQCALPLRFRFKAVHDRNPVACHLKGRAGGLLEGACAGNERHVAQLLEKSAALIVNLHGSNEHEVGLYF